MAQQNRFMIRNEFSKPLTLNIEPEGAFFLLGQRSRGLRDRRVHHGSCHRHIKPL